ncbi:MEDS domain-containing protein [Micromonospora sp. NPDC094482]|uniref:MEDS domain-containing protein n=1 Tax=unclassified Micromonospora TaxID=2617518 RepID=UPI0033318694
MTAVGVVDQVRLGDHACWTYDERTEGLDAVGRFVTAGLRLGHRILCFLDALTPDAVLADLAARGVPTGSALADGRLRLIPAGGSHRPQGGWDRPRMVAAIAAETARAGHPGYAALRLVADMAWALRAGTPVAELQRYESQVDALVSGGRVAALCLYDRRVCSDEQIRAVAAAHTATAGPDAGRRRTPLLRAYRTTDPCGLRLVGEVDRSNGDAFSAMLSDVAGCAPSGRPAVLDVSELAFADVRAAYALLDLGAVPPSDRVRLVGCRPALRRLLDLVGQGSGMETVGDPA